MAPHRMAGGARAVRATESVVLVVLAEEGRGALRQLLFREEILEHLASSPKPTSAEVSYFWTQQKKKKAKPVQPQRPRNSCFRLNPAAPWG